MTNRKNQIEIENVHNLIHHAEIEWLFVFFLNFNRTVLIFYINLPIGIALIVMIMILLEDSEIRSRAHIDFVGASFFFGAILFLMLGLNLIAENFSVLALLVTLLFLAVSFSSFCLFFRQERKDSNPILDTALLRLRPFLASNLCNLITGAGVLGIFSFIPLYATSVHGLSTLMSGMILTPRSLAIIPASVVTSLFLRRWGYRRPMVSGLVIISLATILLGIAPGLWRIIGIHVGAAESIALIVMLSGVGIGIFYPASNNACIELMPEKVATITGLRGMFANVGGTLGISFITIILHLSSTPANGFRTTFLTFGLGLLLTLPLIFLMPTGKGRTMIQESIE